MGDTSPQPEQFSLAALRQQAEMVTSGLSSSFLSGQPGMSVENVERLCHDLRVHQIELELQNEQLRSAQLALELERSRYFDLYELAPVAYLTLNVKGEILQTNLTSAAMFGTPRKMFLTRPFTDFIHRADQDAFYLHVQQLKHSGASQTCQLKLVKGNGATFWGHLVSTAQKEPDGTVLQRLAISDISAQMQVSLAERKAELAYSLLQSREQSRHRFACVLHGQTSANLAALRMNLEWILKTAIPLPDISALTDCVTDTWALLEDTNISIRELCQDLQPPAFGPGGLADAVESYACTIHKRSGLNVQVECHQPEVSLPNDLELALFRIVQEALTNCSKHACATMVTVKLQLDTQPLEISVADDGIGFDPSATAQLNAPDAVVPPGWGLHHMRQTAEFFNIACRVDSAPGRGTCISLVFSHPDEASLT